MSHYSGKGGTMRLGVSLGFKEEDPEEIARRYVEAGYGAAGCPPVSLEQPERIRAIHEAFAKHDLCLAEVGVWNNMLDPDPQKRKANLEANIQKMALAEEVGAVCCVNIAGSFDAEHWDGPHPKNLSEEAFELTVANVRTILDTVQPRRSFYTLETMPWVIPDSPDSYLRLIEAVDRPMFAVHLDPVNMINCPARYYDNAGLLRECFAKLGKWIVSCHAKDIQMSEQLTVHLQERRPGLGRLDYRTFLSELNRLPGDIPLMLEHLPAEEYPLAQQYVLAEAQACGVRFEQGKKQR
jgi:sugar phosphate isomerase/epimerase